MSQEAYATIVKVSRLGRRSGMPRVFSLILLLGSAVAWVLCNCGQFNFKRRAPDVAVWIEDGTIWVYRSSSATLADEMRWPGMRFDSILRKPLGFSLNDANGDWQVRIATWFPMALCVAWTLFLWWPRRRGKYGRVGPRSAGVVTWKWICLLLTATLFSVWAYTVFRRSDFVGSDYGVSVARGAVIVEDMNFQVAQPLPWSTQMQAARRTGWWQQDILEELWGGSPQDWRRQLGLYWINGLTFDSPRFTYVPLWVMIAPIAACWGVLAWIDRKRLLPGLCEHCGYNLAGNVSGRCPECGTPLRPEQMGRHGV